MPVRARPRTFDHNTIVSILYFLPRTTNEKIRGHHRLWSCRTGGFETFHVRRVAVRVRCLRTDRQRRRHMGIHGPGGHGQVRVTGSFQHVQEFEVSTRPAILRIPFGSDPRD